MDDDKSSPDQEEDPVLSLIQQIKDGTLNPRTFPKEKRQRCVEFLSSEGYTEARIGQILAKSEKTIYRDLIEIDARNSLTPSVDLAKEIIGNMFQKAMAHHKHLMRLARGSEATTAEKSHSEYLAWRVLREMVEKMQTLGYLPLKPQAIVSDIYHHSEGGDEKTYLQLRQDLRDMERAAKEAGTFDAEMEAGIKLLQQRIEKAEIAEGIVDLKKDDKDSEKLKKQGDNHEKQ